MQVTKIIQVYIIAKETISSQQFEFNFEQRLISMKIDLGRDRRHRLKRHRSFFCFNDWVREIFRPAGFDA